MRSAGMPVISHTRAGVYSRRARAQLLRPQRVSIEIVGDPRDARAKSTCIMPERERRIGTGPDRDPLVALIGRARAQRIDRDHARAALARLAHERPEMRIRRERVRSPQQHEIALGQTLRIGADTRADRHPHPHRAGHRADGAIEHRGAEQMEEALIHRAALDEPHRAGVRIRKNRLRSVCGAGDRAEPARDLVERLVPA